MKQFKPVIITAIILIVVAALAFAAFKLFPALSEPDVQDPAGGSVASGLTKIIDRAAKDVKSVDITADSGESFGIDYFDDSTGERTAVLRNADPKLKYKTDDMLTLSGFVGLLVALEDVGTGEDSLFGFDKPQREITVTFEGGDPITLLIGSETPLGTGVYIKRTDKAEVYTVGGSTTDILMMMENDYRDITLFSAPDSSDKLMSVSLERPGKPALSLVRKPDADEEKTQEEEAVSSDYALTSPVAVDANPDTVYSALLDKITKISAATLCEDHPQDLKKYGLDSPIRLKFSIKEGADVSLLIGNRAQSGGRYVMAEGVPSVVVTEADIDFLDISHADIMFKLLWFYNSEDIDEISYELPGGETHKMTVSVDETSLTGVFDGKTLEGKNASNLFLRTVRFTLAGEFAPGTPTKGTAIKAAIKLKNGKTTTLELLEMNERQYAAKIDGAAPQYYVGVAEVRELLEAFELLKAGKDIPDMF